MNDMFAKYTSWATQYFLLYLLACEILTKKIFFYYFFLQVANSLKL